ncbi:uncharacterized protein DEA37_0006008 [Paragonimus westermani]|uniref:Protein kinase C-binding protein 1 n=1 Tax=Paragonimus westermani TaxID=34504 RepID=A0A5J4NQF1_9TREM|nr:uncharacterized protein DEA37_0006008 [Paragonimus westermani]
MSHVTKESASDFEADLGGRRLVIDLEAVEPSALTSKMVTLVAADLVPLSSGSSSLSGSTDGKRSQNMCAKQYTLKHVPPVSVSKPGKKKRKKLPLSPQASLLNEPQIEEELRDNRTLTLNSVGALNSMAQPIPKKPNSESINNGFSAIKNVPNLRSDGFCNQILSDSTDTSASPLVPDSNETSSVHNDQDDPTEQADTDSSSWHPSDGQTDDDYDVEAKEMRIQDRRRSGRQRMNPRGKRKIHGLSDKNTEKHSDKKRFRSDSSVRNDAITLDENPPKSGVDLAPESDDYCWICHKVGQMVICSCCPRVYHPSCLCMEEFPDTWLCPECQDLTVSECLLYQQPNWRAVSASRLQRMLCFLIDRLAMQQWAEHFREPVDTEKVAGYRDIISYPMDLRTLYNLEVHCSIILFLVPGFFLQRIISGRYASIQAFLGDFRWIMHNCIVFNGPNSVLTSYARLLDRACVRELALMKACPTCYENRMPALYILPSTPEKLPLLTNRDWLVNLNPSVSSCTERPNTPSLPSGSDPPNCSAEQPEGFSRSLNPWWFCKLCEIVHPLVWIRLQHYPRWPAKVMAIDGDSLLVTFFGDYDVTMAPVGSAQLHSENRVGRSPMPSVGCQPVVSKSQSFDSCSTSVPVGAQNSAPPSPNPPVTTTSTVTLGRSWKGSVTDASVDSNFRQALAELDHYVSLVLTRYPKFTLPPEPLEFSKRHVHRLYKLHSVASKTQHTLAVNRHVPTKALEATPCEDVDKFTLQPHLSDRSGLYSEPLLTRVAASLRDASVRELTPKRMENDTKAYSDPCAVDVDDDSRHDTRTITDSDQPVPMQCVESTAPDTASSGGIQKRPSAVLHPIPPSPHEDCSSSDQIRSMLDKFRSQFNEALQDLESKWQIARSAVDNTDPRFSTPDKLPVPAQSTMEKETQTLFKDVLQTKIEHTETSTIVDKTTKSDTHQSLTSLQAAMMEGEIDRLDRENQRLNLLLAFTRAEMALETRHRIVELRRVWNFEISAILEAASKIWEQDVIRIVDAVKRKQWCAYCGRLAYYYCCWNTCYCNGLCQSKHWASHINVCVQARSQSNTSAACSESDLQVRQQQQQQQQQKQQQLVATPIPISSQNMLTSHLSNLSRWSKTNGNQVT